MPDADDFDVEYFRELLKGKSPKAAPAPPAPTVAKKGRRRKAEPAAAKGKPAVARKKTK